MRKSYAQVMSASASHSFIIASISGVGLSNHSSACTATSAGWEANTLTAYGTVIVGRGKAGRVLVKCVKLHKLYGGGCGVGGWLSIFQLASERSEYEHKSAHGLDHNKSSIKSWLCLHKKRREKLGHFVHSSNKLPKYLWVCEKRKEKFEINHKMEGKAAWQPIAMGGADFNEIWDDTELIKAFSKSINYYKVPSGFHSLWGQC